MSPLPSPSVLFVCTGNAGRSQMAQAMFAAMTSNVHIESAGVEPWKNLHPMAEKTMAGRGLSLAGHYPKSVTDVAERRFDLVVTIGDPALNQLPRPYFSGSIWRHWDIDDPADADGQPDSESVFLKTAERIFQHLSELKTKFETMPPVSRFARQPGIGTILWHRDLFRPDLHLPMIHEAGFKAIELSFFFGKSHFNWDDAGAIRELRRVADDLGVIVWSIHSPDLSPLSSASQSERQEQVDILKRCLDIGADLGSKVVISHALLKGEYDEDPQSDEERIRVSLTDVHNHADGGPVAIGYENTSRASVPDPVRARNILKRLEAFPRSTTGFVWDTGHANMSGDQEEIAQLVGERLVSWHLNDNPGKSDKHLVPGEGTVDWTVVQLALDRFRGPFIYELLSGGRDPMERMKAALAWHRRYVDRESNGEDRIPDKR